MTMDAAALACSACGSYVHPFLEACVACGARRGSRYGEAAGAPDLGIRALLDDPGLASRVREVALRYSMKVTQFGARVATEEVRESLAQVLGSLPYGVRCAGVAADATSRQAYAELVRGDLVVRERHPAREVVRVPLRAIVAVGHAPRRGAGAAAWAGLAFDGRVEHPAPLPVDGALVVTWGTTDGPGRLGLGNAGGLLAPRARRDHYEIVARWLGLVAAAAAEADWVEVGARRHAAELGLAAMPPAAGPEAHGAEMAGGDAGPGTGGVRRALEELEDLRAAGLVTPDEYEAKRREILARL